jgi:hypothetical protein
MENDGDRHESSSPEGFPVIERRVEFSPISRLRQRDAAPLTPPHVVAVVGVVDGDDRPRKESEDGEAKQSEVEPDGHKTRNGGKALANWRVVRRHSFLIMMENRNLAMRRRIISSVRDAGAERL